MNILLICAHPSGDSFNQALKASFLEGCRDLKYATDIIDLYGDQFNPVLSAEEMYSKTPLDEIKIYQEKIKKADILTFIFPIWWYRSPAILEGFIDRVFTSGFAYQYIGKRPKGLLPCQKAVVIETYGGPAIYYYFTGNLPWRRFRSTLKFCGIKQFIHHPCFYAPFTSDAKRKKWLKEVKQIPGRL